MLCLSYSLLSEMTLFVYVTHWLSFHPPKIAAISSLIK